MKTKKLIYLILVLFVFAMFLTGCTPKSFVDYSAENINSYTYDDENTPNDAFSDLTFMTASDLHYFSHTLHDNGKAFADMQESANSQMLDLNVEITEQFKEEVIKTAPDFLLITGDLTFNGEKASHEELSALLKEIESHDIDVLVVPGNHDINNVYAREFFGESQIKTPYVTYDEFAEIYAEFGPDLAVMRDENSFSYVVEAGDTWFLMLDSNRYENNIDLGYPETGGVFAPEQMKWIEGAFLQAFRNDKEIIAAMHHNMVPHADVSLLFISDYLVAGATSGINELFAQRDVNLVFSGHIHCHDIAGVRYEDDFIYDITTGALTVYPHNYRVCELSSDGKISIATEHIESLDGYTFDGKSFGEYSRDLAYEIKDFGMVDGVSEKDAQVMARYATDAANAYFEGTDYKFSLDKSNEKGYMLWSEYPQNTPQKYFILGMSKDTEPRDNDVVIDLNTGYWD